jgi:hypothetical protein
MGQEGERKRTVDDVSKVYRWHRNRGMITFLGMSLGETCLLPRWCPAWRRRELGLGSGVERGNLSPRCGGREGGGGRDREDPKQQELRGAEYRCGARGRTVP